jgi:RNA polymerase sigma-70 factor (ECF subfamily)
MTPTTGSTMSRDVRVADEEVFRPLYQGLRRFAAVVAPMDVEPEDLLQDSLVQTLRRHNLSDLDNPAAYLRRAMVNLASNHKRRWFTRRSAMRSFEASMSQQVEAYPSDLSDLEWLTPRQRAVLYLAEVEGYPFAEVAELVGCSEPAARMAASRGRKRLRQALTGEA